MAGVGAPRSHSTAARLVVLALVVSLATASTESIHRRFERKPETYAGAFTDFDFFVLGIGAELIRYHRASGTPVADWLTELPMVSEAIMRKGVIQLPNGGWVFEPGVWRDYPDFRYAGADSITVGMAEHRINDIAGDASHFTRWPLWLRADAAAAATMASRVYFDSLQVGLRKQFLSRVLVLPDSESRLVRTRNYMDGHNGVFRYGYESHPTTGYGPYQLSGTLFYGWWAFLGGKEVANAYHILVKGFPYSDRELRTYLGPWTNATPYRNGRNLLLAILAERIANDINAEQATTAPAVGPVHDSLSNIWHCEFLPMLKASIWQGGQAESVQYVLMLPLHAAFWLGETEWQDAFDDHFRRFSQSPQPYRSARLLARLHYLYFASRYLVLSAEAHRARRLPSDLPRQIENELHSLWTDYDQPISNYGWGEPMFNDFRSYLYWKLSQRKTYTTSYPQLAPPTNRGSTRARLTQ